MLPDTQVGTEGLRAWRDTARPRAVGVSALNVDGAGHHLELL